MKFILEIFGQRGQNMYLPYLTFSYQLLDTGDNLLLEEQENIRDVLVLQKVYLRYKNEAFYFEK
jgi:hypothetical protein